MNKVTDRYTSDQYMEDNPSWDMEDSQWKAAKVTSLLNANHIKPQSVCEVGCGAGKIIEALAVTFSETQFLGFDIAPAAQQFWQHNTYDRVNFKLGDFFKVDSGFYDVALVLDVLEHVENPQEFLASLKNRSTYVVIHFPLDLSALNVLRETPLLHVRRKVGHIHYFTKGLALELVKECGFKIIDFQYTGAAFNAPQSGIKTKLAQIPRKIAYSLNKDIGVRLLGGETLMVLAQSE